MKLFDPLQSVDPRQCLVDAYDHALAGGQSLIIRSLGGVRIGHLLDSDLLRLQLTAKRYIDGHFRFIPQLEGLYRVDLVGESFERAFHEMQG